MPDAAAIHRQIAIVRRELDALDQMLEKAGFLENPGFNGATAPTADNLRELCKQEGFFVSLIDEVDADAACALLGIEPWQLKRLVSEGILQPHRVAGTRRNKFTLTNIAQVRHTKGD